MSIKNKKYRQLNLQERKAYWKALPEERKTHLLRKIMELAINAGRGKNKKPQPSYQLTDRQKRARGAWAIGTSH